MASIMNSIGKRSKSTAVSMAMFILVAGYYAPDTMANCGETYCLNWSTIDNGGIVASSSDDEAWELSGSIGQADASKTFALVSGQWRLTGGFWASQTGNLTDDIFEDRFEDP